MLALPVVLCITVSLALLRCLCAACSSLSSINPLILPPCFSRRTFPSLHSLPRPLSFSFYRWQQWPPLNTSPTADVFNMMPSVSPLGFFSVALSMSAEGVASSLPFSLPPHYSSHSAGQSPYPLDFHSGPQWPKKIFVGWLDFRADLLDLVTQFDCCALISNIFVLGLKSLSVAPAQPTALTAVTAWEYIC